MQFRLLTITLLLLSGAASAQGRKPAVEDFVGIEVEQPETPAGSSGSLYNLEQDMNQVKLTNQISQRKKPITMSDQATGPGLGFTAIFAAILILGLPLLSWFLVLNHLRNKATQENANNIEVLENYRKDRMAKKNESDKIKKVS